MAASAGDDGPCKLVRFATGDQAARCVAEIVRDHVAAAEKPVLGLATGRTMLPVYRWLRAWCAAGTLSLARSSSFNLDEYCGLLPGDPSRFAAYMRRHLFDHADMAPDQIHLPDERAPMAYDEQIRHAGGIDLQVLGIGRNGHIGFNEPGADRHGRTHVVELAASTRAANAADFPTGAFVPTHAVTMGIGTILEARRIVLLATGEAKAQALDRAFHGPVGPDCPASFLQLHRSVTVICDAAAARLAMAR